MNEHSGSLNSIQWTFALVILQETLAAFPIQVPHLVPGAHDDYVDWIVECFGRPGLHSSAVVKGPRVDLRMHRGMSMCGYYVVYCMPGYHGQKPYPLSSGWSSWWSVVISVIIWTWHPFKPYSTRPYKMNLSQLGHSFLVRYFKFQNNKKREGY
ncbi:hypothetical protein PCH_Pc21g15790 [Penicillium rubens Wisconsin 54-1255]|uniref:Uncharacterized protein n=1 Tax=Penicillium rubens (strain ATCC 28089 / DSM 1075 / NRRL 1951 / Wisconsin 54-1255) TaxID=500485 RepID=B6HK75_PENRW|nr:hypothetical protein PCH_Pc21g15790 [Penicillium rubens Wisconsin 54-1255]